MLFHILHNIGPNNGQFEGYENKYSDCNYVGYDLLYVQRKC